MKRLLLLITIVMLASFGAPAQVTFAGGVSGSVTRNCVPKATVTGTIATTVICSDGTTLTINTDKVSITEASGNTLIAGTLGVTGAITASGGFGSTGALTVTSASASSLAVGRLGATTPAFTVDSSTSSQVAGLKIVGAATAGTVAVVVTDSGTDANLTINAKGSGTIGIGSVSTGAVTITPATTITGALTASSTIIATGAINGPFGATRVTGSTQAITAAMSGRLFAVNNASDAVTVLTLPAAATAGLRYCFSADAVTGSNREVDVETPAGSDLIIGTTTSAGGTGIASTAGASHGIKNTHASAVRGNAVCVQSDGVNTWYMTSLSGTWASY